MKKILILSSTLNSNLDMSNQIKNFLDTKDNITSEVISLEQFDLPLYTPSLEEKFKSNNSFPESIEKAKNVLIDSEAIIWCSPEYNGGISPIVTNTIAWISRATEDWREAFNKKNVLYGLHKAKKPISKLKSLIISSSRSHISELEISL